MAATRRRRARRIGKSAFLAVASLLMIAPFLWALSTSFKLPGDVFAYPPSFLPDPATLDNFQNVVTKIPFPRYLLNSTIVTGTIVVLNVIFGTAAAYAFAKLRFPGRDAIFFLLLLTLMVPFQVNLIPLYKMMVELHKAIPPLGADTYFGLIAPARGIRLRDLPDARLPPLDPGRDPRVGPDGRRVGVARPPLDRLPARRARAWPPWRSSPSWPPGTTSSGRWSSRARTTCGRSRSGSPCWPAATHRTGARRWPAPSSPPRR